MTGLDQSRSTARFASDEPVAATFATAAGQVSVALRDVSVNGAQIEHTQSLRPGSEGRLFLGDLAAPAVVIWTKMTVPGRYRSGLRIDEKLDVVAAEIREMLARGVVRKVEDTLRRREQAKIEREQTRLRLVGGPAPSDEPTPSEIERIRAARQWMLAHPEDAVKWYLRARATSTEDHLRVAGSGRMNREDVLAVWEYLERSIDLRHVAKTLE